MIMETVMAQMQGVKGYRAASWLKTWMV